MLGTRVSPLRKKGDIFIDTYITASYCEKWGIVTYINNNLCHRLHCLAEVATPDVAAFRTELVDDTNADIVPPKRRDRERGGQGPQSHLTAKTESSFQMDGHSATE